MGLSWRSKDGLICDVLLWISSHGSAEVGQPARTYLQQLCTDTGCCLEDLPKAMDNRDEWRESEIFMLAASPEDNDDMHI